jgi:hypothetical protein
MVVNSDAVAHIKLSVVEQESNPQSASILILCLTSEINLNQIPPHLNYTAS